MQIIGKIVGVLVCCFLTIPQSLSAQDIMSDLKKISEARSQGWRKMRVNYISYETHHAKEAEDNTGAVSVENGSNESYFDNELSTSVSVHGKTLLLDKEEKKIYLLDQKGIMDGFGKIEPDSLLKLCSDIRFLGSEAGVYSYELAFNSPLFEFSKVRLSLNMKQLYVSGVTIFYQKEMPKLQGTEVVAWLKPRLKILYTLEEVTPQDKVRLDLGYYVTRKGDTWTPKPAFKNYEIIDQISKP